LWLLLAAWGAGLGVLSETYFRRVDRAALAERVRSVVSLHAVSAGDAFTVDDPLAAEALVRRLAGEDGSLYAVLVSAEGRVEASAGDLPGPSRDRRLSGEALAAPSFRLREEAGDRPFWEASHPVWSRGRRWGTLRWGLGTDRLDKSARAHRRRWLAAWAWWALLSGVAASVYVRRTGRWAA
jgi:hypothetical protein